ncbi:MAG: YggS family pyridoxal phosphate-dependent enzyme [Candidatus Izemoplasma sp.]|nr:YggS family pyridoxal phosphate-dependent enzyme [Candidatus Izemoplasma sp.]
MKIIANKVLNELKETPVTLVAATKYFTPDKMRELYHQGVKHFGENRVSALLAKQEALADLDITWHFIGTLQTKKIKKMINQIDYLHSIHKLKTAKEVNKRRKTPLNCFLQVNISDEENKHGFSKDAVVDAVKAIEPLPNVNLIGLMGMASHTDDESVINQQFQILNDLQDTIKETLNISLDRLSIGMSNDYKIALRHNSSFIRLGSVLFKEEV